MARAAVVSAICLAVLATFDARARILDVVAVDGAPGQIIAAPPQVMDSDYASPRMTGFDERQNVLLEADLPVDGGTIPKGTRVSSHMILFNVPDSEPGGASENIWVFSGPVIGVMSDVDGQLEAGSAFLGAPGTAYPPGAFPNRGFEERDWYRGVGTTRLHIHMWVWQPGDWIRVITGEQPVAGATPPAQLAEQPRGKRQWPH